MNDDDRYEECRRRAIAAGALKPQGIAENMAAGVMAHQQGIAWASTAKAQYRLQVWIQDCLEGRAFSKI
jgi:hypothetical protein